MIGHIFLVMNYENNLPDFAKYIIDLAVPCFFVVSGYLITASAINNNLKTYFKKRIARIYPAYFLSLLIVPFILAPICYFIVYNGFDLLNYVSLSPSPIDYIIYGLPLYLGCPVIGDILINLPYNYWNTSIWTLSFEFACYILIALVIFLLNKLKKEKYTFVVVGLYVLFLVISFFYLRPRVPVQNSGFLTVMLTYGSNLFSIFLGGSIVYLVKDKIKFNIKYVILALSFSIIIMSILPYGWATEICAIPFIYIILYLAIVIKSPKFIKENDISYGVYVFSWPIQTTLACFLLTNKIYCNPLVFFIISSFLVVGMSLLSWFLVEKPILNKVRS